MRSVLIGSYSPGLTAHGLQAVFSPLSDDLTCELCKEALGERLRDVVSRWVSVQVGLVYFFFARLFTKVSPQRTI